MNSDSLPLNVLSFNLDPRILDQHSPIAERERSIGTAIARYTLLIPFSKDTRVTLTDLVTAYGVSGKNKFIQLIKIYRKADQLLTQNKYDVLTIQDAYYLAFIGWLIARKHNLSLEIQIHGFEKFSGLRALLAKFIIPKADSIRSASLRLKRNLIDRFKINEDVITVAPVFFEVKNVLPKKNQTINVHRQLISEIVNQKKKDFIFLAVSRLVTVKNIPLQLQAFKKLNVPETQLWIVGDGPEKALIEATIQELGLQDRIKMWGWHPDPAPFYAHADAFLLSSDSEGWGLVILEAAAYSLPIIMTDVGCAGEFIHDKENGLIVPLGDVRAFEAAMNVVQSDSARREMMGMAAYSSLSLLPSKKELIDRYVTSWKKAVSKHHKK